MLFVFIQSRNGGGLPVRMALPYLSTERAGLLLGRGSRPREAVHLVMNVEDIVPLRAGA